MTYESPASERPPSKEIDPTVPHQARVWNYWVGGPLVLTRARALLTSSPEGVTAYAEADVRDVDRILAEAARTLDLDRPVALMMLGILGDVPDHEEARSIVRRLVDALAPGSCLVVNDGSDTSAERVQATEEYTEKAADPYTNRSPQQIASFLDGLELLDPGVVSTSRWRPDPTAIGGPPEEVAAYCGVARKP